LWRAIPSDLHEPRTRRFTEQVPAPILVASCRRHMDARIELPDDDADAAIPLPQAASPPRRAARLPLVRPRHPATMTRRQIASLEMPPNMLRIAVTMLGLPLRVKKVLTSNGTHTAGDLLQRDEPDLLWLRGLGRKSLSVILDRLRDAGFIVVP
jgi:hypothetical protein